MNRLYNINGIYINFMINAYLIILTLLDLNMRSVYPLDECIISPKQEIIQY